MADLTTTAADTTASGEHDPLTPSSAAAPPDPFDPSSLRLTDDFTTSVGVKKALITVPVRKPDKSWFVRTHPDDKYRLQTAVIEMKDDRETYLVARPLWAELATESTFSPRALITAINRQGVLFIWPCRMPGADGKLDQWSRSALEATEMARCGWVRVQANMSLGAYEVSEAAGDLPDPEWPTTPLAELLRVAFRDRYIDTRDHSVLRELRGY